MQKLEQIAINSTKQEGLGKKLGRNALKHLFSAALTISTLSGCTAGDLYIRDHPGLSNKTKQDIRGHVVSKGMSKSEVIASVEEPYAIKKWRIDLYNAEIILMNESASSDHPFQDWIYRRHLVESNFETRNQGFGAMSFEWSSRASERYKEFHILFDGNQVWRVHDAGVQDPSYID